MNWQNLLDIVCMKIEQFLVFLRRTIVAITRQVVEAIMLLLVVVVEGDIMEDGIILIAEEDRIITITRTTREKEIITTAEEEEVVVVVEVVGEVMPKVLLEKVTIKEETPIAVRMEEEAARIALRVEGEVDRIIKEGVITRIKKDTQDGTRTNILKIQE